MKHEAIYKLYPNVATINENATTGVLTAYDQECNLVEFDSAAVDAKATELQAEADAKPSYEELQASAKAKLIAGEKLTEEEANILVGV